MNDEKVIVNDAAIAEIAAKIAEFVADYGSGVTFAELQNMGLIEAGNCILHPNNHPKIAYWLLSERSLAVMVALNGKVHFRPCNWLCYAHDGFLPANLPMLKSKGKSDRQLKELKKLHWAPVAIFAGPVPPERLAKLKKAAR